MPVSRIREVDHAELSPMENNPNKGTKRGHKLIRQSLSKLGAGRSIGVSADGKAFAGNQTLEAAVELGLPITTVETWGDTLIAVKRMDLHSDDPRFMELAIADNKTSQEGIDWDLDSLEIAVEEGVSLDDWFYEDELENIDGLTGNRRGKKLTGVNMVLEEEIDLESIKIGDAFILGRHRLVVGLAEKRGDAAVMIAAWGSIYWSKSLARCILGRIWRLTRGYLMPYSDAARCKSLNREGQPCGQPAMKNGRCRVHGGKVPARGASHQSFTGTSRNTRYQDAISDPELLANYIEILNDPELLNLSSEIALMRAHSIQLIQRITTNGESAARWERATKAYNTFVMATREKARAKQAQALRDMQIVFMERDTDRVLWEEVHETMKTMDRLVKAENKRRATMHAMMSTEQAVGLIARLVGVIQNVVTDEATVRKIHKEFRELIVETPALAVGINRVEGNKAKLHRERFFAPGDLPESLEAMVLQE